MTQLEITTSTDSAGRGIASISPRSHSTFSTPALRWFSRASASISSVMSSPYALPVGPTRLAESSTSIPPPEPRSSTVSPALSSATAVGLPQPSEAIVAVSGSSLALALVIEPGAKDLGFLFTEHGGRPQQDRRPRACRSRSWPPPHSGRERPRGPPRLGAARPSSRSSRTPTSSSSSFSEGSQQSSCGSGPQQVTVAASAARSGQPCGELLQGIGDHVVVGPEPLPLGGDDPGLA